MRSKSLTIAEVAKGQKLVKTIPADVAITPVSEWTIAGTSVPKVDGRDFVTGKHQYTSDMKREGMLFGRVVRPTALECDACFERHEGSRGDAGCGSRA